ALDWFCVPRFDSPSIFGAILDKVRGGTWRICAVGATSVERSYVPDTNVLTTTWLDDDGPIVTLTDFLTFSRVNAFDPRLSGHLLLRHVAAHRSAEVDVVFQPRFDYARRHTTIEITGYGLKATAGPDDVVDLLADVEWLLADHQDNNGNVAIARLQMQEGDDKWFRLQTRFAEHGPHSHLDGPALLELTVRTWRRWAGGIRYEGPYQDHVRRSALVLKGLVYEPTGALVAAPTTSLPEGLGGERNWDYRYAWIRDSAYVLETFLRIGHSREAETFIRWLDELTKRIGGAHSLRPLYRITGEEDLEEVTLDHLDGYANSTPVRVGNGAATQLQLDIYGAAMQLGWLTVLYGNELPSTSWPVILELVDTVVQRWRDPDAGLWEIRSDPKHHTFSKFQCWLAIDRAIRIGQDLGVRGPYEFWQDTADEIRTSIETQGYDATIGAFTQSYGETDLDASILLLPLKGFVDPRDPRVRSTVEAVRRELEVGDGLLLRYRTADGLDGHEGAFLMCSFWLVEVLARMGDLDEAERLMDKLVGLSGPLGLFAEEYDVASGEQLGNFPQGFTHMGLIGAATAIAEERAASHRGPRETSSHQDPLVSAITRPWQAS
ncbi:MAG: GH15 family glucan-1,4-alpha-glucosidase, partial [Glaciecola sp.]